MRQVQRGCGIAFVLTFVALAGVCQGQALVGKSPFALLQEAPPLPMTHLGVDGVAKLFPAFKHVPFDASGFRSIALPFHYVDPDHLGNANEANAMAFLLSDAMDFAPGSYGSRHCYFVFKRSRQEMMALAQMYDPAVITQVMKNWEATHAIGGTLARLKDGYGGSVVVYDDTGKPLHETKFDKGRPFYTLLGDMAVDLLTYFGPRPTESLVRFLHVPSSKKPQSLIDLGSAAFMEPRSIEEFGAYQRILVSDPDFAQVRFWAANQKYWMDRNEANYSLETALSLKSRLSINALSSWTPAACPDKMLAAHYEQWSEKLGQILGPDHPFTLQQRLEFGHAAPDFLATIRKATEVAGKYPNDRRLLIQLAHAYKAFNIDAADPAMTISILCASLQNHYMTGTGEKPYERHEIAYDLINLGRPDIALELITWPGKKDTQDVDTVVNAAAFCGQYPLALDAYLATRSALSPEMEKRCLPAAAFSALMSGRQQTFNDLVSQRQQELAAKNIDDGFERLGKVAGGLLFDPGASAGHSKGPTSGYDVRWVEVGWYANDIARVKTDARQYMIIRLGQDPFDRHGWIYYDAYDKIAPSPDAADFYSFLEWMFPDDPWAAAAVKAFTGRANRRPLCTPASVLSLLDRASRQPPGRHGGLAAANKIYVQTYSVASAVRQLILAKRSREAVQLANANVKCRATQVDWAAGYAAYAIYHRAEAAAEEEEAARKR